MFKRVVLDLIILMTFLSVGAINLERLGIIFNFRQSYRKWDLQTSRNLKEWYSKRDPQRKIWSFRPGN